MEAYLPAVPLLAKDLGVSIVEANLTISTFLLGAGFGHLLGGPISDQLGRRNNVIFGLSVFTLASIGIMFSNDIYVIQGLRFVQALGGGFASIVGMPTIRDIYPPEEAAQKMPVVSAIMLIAPMVAPIFGSILMQWGWRIIFAFLAAYAAILLLLYVWRVPETREKLAPLSLKKVLQQFSMVIRHRPNGKHVGLRYILLIGFSSGVFLTFLTNASWTYLHYFGVSDFQFPLFFAIHVLAFFIANLFVSRVFKRFDPARVLRVAVNVQLLMTISFLALTVLTDITVSVYVLMLMLVLGCGPIISSSVMAMLFTYFERLTGSVMSLLAFFRFLCGAAFGALSGLFFDGTLIPTIAIMLLCSLLCNLVTRTLPNDSLKTVAAQPRGDFL